MLNVNNTEVFQSFVRKESYKINYKFHWDRKFIIYLFSFKACGLQYADSTVERFCFRWNDYKNCQRKEAQGDTSSQIFLSPAFVSEGHHGLVSDCEITLIDKTDSLDPTGIFWWKFFWMGLFRTYHSLGLNIEEEL